MVEWTSWKPSQDKSEMTKTKEKWREIFVNSLKFTGNYLFDSKNDAKLMHKTYWKVHLNSEEVFLLDMAAVLSPWTIKNKILKW